MEENRKFGYNGNQGGARFCGSCGTKLTETQAFCPFCGAMAPEKKAPVAEEPDMDATIVAPGFEAEPVKEPVYEAPVVQEPVYEAPAAQEPVYEAPVAQEPVYEDPAAETDTTFCGNCGTKMSVSQAFCPSCGTKAPEKAPAAKKFCAKCGSELMAGQDFCTVCGYRPGFEVDPPINTAISQYNAGIETGKKKSKAIPAIIAVVLVAIIALVAVLGISSSNKKKEEQALENKEQYVADATEFLDLYLDAGVNLEDVADRIVEYWYDCIWYDYYGDDINLAIAYALEDSEYELGLAEDYDADIKALYNELKNLPSNIPEESRYYLEKICDAVKAAYDVYVEYYALATDPSGSYNSYTDEKETVTDEYLDAYHELEDSLLT